MKATIEDCKAVIESMYDQDGRLNGAEPGCINFGPITACNLHEIPEIMKRERIEEMARLEIEQMERLQKTETEILDF